MIGGKVNDEGKGEWSVRRKGNLMEEWGTDGDSQQHSEPRESQSSPHRRGVRKGRLFRRRPIGTAGEALQPSAVSFDEEFPRLEGWDAKEGRNNEEPSNFKLGNL
jgi:hypothetical protein